MKEKVTSGGLSFVSLLQLAFIILKLVKVISWPWGWVIAPTWISAALVLLFTGIVFIVAIVRSCGWKD
jgi:hypothetical protein|nr:MAG TPA_asm: hypothetical protein [Caudoviricetes sp.]